jgi:CYTH domain-containing protein
MTSSMKYARIERERRFLVRDLPADLPSTDYQRILDRYIPGTRLRLRRIESPAGETLALKLTQKYPAAGPEAIITNVYLNEVEYQRLDILAGSPLHKRRYGYRYRDHHYSIDVFEGHLLGLILCEVEAESDERLLAAPIPPFATREVTNDPFFTGGRLATLTSTDVQVRLTDLGIIHSELVGKL